MTSSNLLKRRNKGFILTFTIAGSAKGNGYRIWHWIKKIEITENNNSNEAHIICIRERNICQVICYIKKKSRSL